MKKNNYKDSRESSKNIRKRDISLTETPGVYGANPDPGLREYKQSMGKDTIPNKFAERPFNTTKRNPMDPKSPTKGKRAPEVTTSTINKKKNRYDNVKKNVLGIKFN